MKHVRAIGIGVVIWIIGVSLYALSFYIPILENPELQANIFLSIGVVPLVWFGSKLYYRKNSFNLFEYYRNCSLFWKLRYHVKTRFQ